MKDKEVVAVKPRTELEPFFKSHELEKIEETKSEPDQASSLVGKWRKRRGSVTHEQYIWPVLIFPNKHTPLQRTCAIPTEQWAVVRTKATAGRSLRSLAAEYGVSHETIRAVIRQADG